MTETWREFDGTAVSFNAGIQIINEEIAWTSQNLINIKIFLPYEFSLFPFDF